MGGRKIFAAFLVLFLSHVLLLVFICHNNLCCNMS
jgi:hypothetical protein